MRNQAFALMTLGVVSLITHTGQDALFGYVSSQMTLNLKKRWFHALLRQDATYYDLRIIQQQQQKDDSGGGGTTAAAAGYATQLSVQAEAFQAGIGTKLGNGIQQCVSLTILFVLAFISSWKMALIILATIPFVMLAFLNLFRINAKQSAHTSEQYVIAGNLVYTTIKSFKTILSLDMVDYQLYKFQQATSQMLHASTKYTIKGGIALGLTTGAFLLIFLVVALYGSYLLYDQVRDNGCDPSGTANPNNSCDPEGGNIFGALLAIVFAAWGIPQINDALQGLAKSQAACYPAFQVMEKSESSSTKNNNTINNNEKKNNRIDPLAGTGLSPEFDTVQRNIQFHDVSFAYPNRKEQPIFKSLSLNIPAGSKVAFVGGSGAGKSTIIQLLMRLYDPDSGSITLDGNALPALNLQWLRNTIGLVGQEPVLFSGTTIRDNIAMGIPGATQERIEAAAKQANAHDFIRKFPLGYDTILQSQNQLSGGQKQRVAIARCLIRNPKIIALDEATSALDSESEKQVQKALDDVITSSKSSSNR